MPLGAAGAARTRRGGRGGSRRGRRSGCAGWTGRGRGRVGFGGAVTGGLTDFSLPAGLSPLDHDQRNTLNVGGDVNLPWRSYVSTNVYYGSGFSNAFPGQPYPGDYLPQHTTFDLSLGKDFKEKYSISVTSLNVANRRVELDNSVTFGGFHWNNPREIYDEFRYRFHY